jgi:hypothetical protein
MFGLALVLDLERVQNADAFPTATRINAGLPRLALHVAGVGIG